MKLYNREVRDADDLFWALDAAQKDVTKYRDALARSQQKEREVYQLCKEFLETLNCGDGVNAVGRVFWLNPVTEQIESVSHRAGVHYQLPEAERENQ